MNKIPQILNLTALTIGAPFMTEAAAQSTVTTPNTITSPGQYLGPNITRVYYADDLQSQYAILDLVEGDLFTLEFPINVVDIIFTREGMVGTRILGTKVVVAATAQQGTLPIAVVLEDGRMLYFMAKFGKGASNTMKSIRVIERAQPAAAATNANGGMQAATPITPDTAHTNRSAEASPAPAPVMPAPVTASAAVLPQPVPTTPAPVVATVTHVPPPPAPPASIAAIPATVAPVAQPVAEVPTPEPVTAAAAPASASPVATMTKPPAAVPNQTAVSQPSQPAATPAMLRPTSTTATVPAPPPPPVTTVPTQVAGKPAPLPTPQAMKVSPAPRAEKHSPVPPPVTIVPVQVLTPTPAQPAGSGRPVTTPATSQVSATPVAAKEAKAAPAPVSTPAAQPAPSTRPVVAPPAERAVPPSPASSTATRAIRTTQGSSTTYNIVPPSTPPAPQPVRAAAAPPIPSPAQAKVEMPAPVVPSPPAVTSPPAQISSPPEPAKPPVAQAPSQSTRPAVSYFGAPVPVTTNPPAPPTWTSGPPPGFTSPPSPRMSPNHSVPAPSQEPAVQPAPIPATPAPASASTGTTIPFPATQSTNDLLTSQYANHVDPQLVAQFTPQFDGENYVLYYRIRNNSNEAYQLDEHRLQVTITNLPVRLIGDRTTTVQPGETAYGTVQLVDNRLKPTSAMTIEWPARQHASGFQAVMKIMVSVSRAELPNWQAVRRAAVRPSPRTSLLAKTRTTPALE